MAVASTADSSVALYVATALFFALLSYIWMLKRRRGPSLPPGPFGLPLLGYLPFLGPDLHRCFADLSRTYGPVMSVRLGSMLCVVLSSASAAREALRDNDLAFVSHDVPSAVLVVLGGNDMLWAPYGPLWRMLRKISVRDLLSAHSLAAVRPLREREVRRMVAALRAKEGSTVEIRETAFVTMLNVITSMLWGGTNDDHEGTGKEFMQVMDGVMEGFGKPNVSDFFPVLSCFDFQGVARELAKFTEWYFRIFDTILDGRRKKMKSEEGAEAQRDFLQVMLEMVDRGGDSGMPLTIDHVKGLFLNLVAGGTDTISTTVEWAMAELLDNPTIMKKLRDELDSVVGKNMPVVESAIPKLPYLDAIVKEAFRLHPPGPLLVPYSTDSAVTVSGFEIPRGTRVFINVWKIHRDPSVWKDPLRFEPERFVSGDNKCDDYGGNNYNYLPFGSGRRICPGISLGEKMVAYLLASLVHLFEWRLPEGADKVDPTDDLRFVLRKKTPLVAIPLARSSKS